MRTKYFNIQELVHPFYYNRFGNGAWKFLNERQLYIIDYLREEIDEPITINNWHVGGKLDSCGLRPFNDPDGAEFSIHKFGGATDLHFKKSSPKLVYDYILANEKKFYDIGIRRIENIKYTPTWVHIDCSNTDLLDKIVIFNA
jgi:hypothetical protein